MTTVIVEYGCGNPASIRNMLKKLGHTAQISGDFDAVRRASRLILPGVGAFDFVANRLREANLVAPLEETVLGAKVPILGVCVGMQLLFRSSEEGKEPGLGWIAGDCVRFDAQRLSRAEKIPHMGWAELSILDGHGLFAGVPQPPRYYFVHSYHAVCDDPNDVAATARHGYDFTAAVARDNIAGVQFHPEKSHQFGMGLLRNFIQWQPQSAAA